MIKRPNPHTIIAGPTDVVDLAGRASLATITVGAEVSNVRPVTIILKDARGVAITSRQTVQIAMLADANGDAFAAAGGSTGLALAVDGALLPIVAKKLFLAISEANGSITLTYTDTGTEVVYLAVILNGKMIISAALTNT